MEANKIVVQKDLLAFSSEVSNLVQDGWQLVGGVLITEDKSTPDDTSILARDTTEPRFIYSQALWKAS